MCDIVGCDEKAVYEDPMGNQLCVDCWHRDMQETGQGLNDYETIASEPVPAQDGKSSRPDCYSIPGDEEEYETKQGRL